MSIETRNWTVVGTVHTPAISYRGRLSDLLNQKEVTFLSITDVDVYRVGDTEPSFATAYLAVNLRHIEMVRPLEG